MPRCRQKTLKGTRCKRKSTQGDYCTQHHRINEGRTVAVVVPTDDTQVKTPSKRNPDPEYPLRIRGLRGVNRFTYYPDVQSRRILLLGESHNRDVEMSPYTMVNVWLHDLIEAAPVCVDLFIESPFEDRLGMTIPENFKNKLTRAYISPMHLTSYEFENCNAGHSRKCHLEKLRLHSVDTRTAQYDYAYVIGNSLINKTFKESITEISSLSETDRTDILRYMSGLEENENGRIKLLTVFKPFDVDVNEYLRMRKLAIARNQKLINKIPGFSVERFLNILIPFYSLTRLLIVTAITSFEMDVYFLLRFLHVYDRNKMGRLSGVCQNEEYEIAKYSIVYTGSAHTDVYMRFFNVYFETSPTIDLDSPEKSIEFEEPFGFFDGL
jgi:hypothetical protein